MQYVPAIGSLLIAIGAWGMLTQRNMLKMVIGFSIIDTGAHLLIVSIGYVTGGAAPIIDADVAAGALFVDPVPSALVLTAIVIGLAVTALMLTYVVRLARTQGTLEVSSYKELKW
ncbi:MAG: sodium:proton antiporter [Spirochaetota bacterium]